MKAIEVTGMINEAHQLQLDAPLPVAGPHRVRVIVLIPEENDIDDTAWLKAAATNQAFDFLKAPEEELYSLADGKPFHDQG
uniref:Hypothetical conserved protein n=1 Tax=Acetithermum autotrophicum TaxID=1446466 RepID=H5SV59_ACEAU|nr:hypothetical conserved protein [Candidatus Acetothermum autotrophicum]